MNSELTGHDIEQHRADILALPTVPDNYDGVVFEITRQDANMMSGRFARTFGGVE